MLFDEKRETGIVWSCVSQDEKKKAQFHKDTHFLEENLKPHFKLKAVSHHIL